jgi:hypothetical protein
MFNGIRPKFGSLSEAAKNLIGILDGVPDGHYIQKVEQAVTDLEDFCILQRLDRVAGVKRINRETGEVTYRKSIRIDDLLEAAAGPAHKASSDHEAHKVEEETKEIDHGQD